MNKWKVKSRKESSDGKGDEGVEMVKKKSGSGGKEIGKKGRGSDGKKKNVKRKSL